MILLLRNKLDKNLNMLNESQMITVPEYAQNINRSSQAVSGYNTQF